MACWIVEPNALGGWDARAASAAGPAHRGSSRERAEDRARSLAAPGDEVLVLDSRGRVLDRVVQLVGATDRPRRSPGEGRARPSAERPPPPSAAAAPEPPPAAPGSPSLRERLDTEGARWNALLEWVRPIGMVFGTTGVSAVMADAGGNWIVVVLGTLTWSGGMAGATYAIKAGRLTPPWAVGVAAVSLLAALGVAHLVGVGVLDVDLPPMEVNLYLPYKIIFAFASAAVLAYGLIGAILSGLIGVWLGWRLAERFPNRNPPAHQPG
ncbi:hypothetical protein [Modestobacter marinus]|uniref:hypothetical protein n=1 Tax=Modestobacter marinus TaxID=477641 RepID=UPI001C96CC3E|nr:hypothetical protein [Modestobacter marinus]